VQVEGRLVGQIGLGLLVLLGVAKGDGEADCRSLAEKLGTFRIFSDEQGKMNRSVADVGGAILLVSQFTLLGNTMNGRRPSFEDAAPPEEAKRFYEQVADLLRGKNIKVETGVFAAHMTVQLVNDGPVTFVLESR
jgi:D-tyrosyl-tRNA(Tyr) deacylase